MAWRTVMARTKKNEANVNVYELDSDDNFSNSTDRATHPQHDVFDEAWTPGKNIPWIAIAEIAIAILCTIAAILVVTLSDGKLQGSWNIRPSVTVGATKYTKQYSIEPKLLLSILSSVLSLMLGLAFKEGLTVSWWRRALVGGNIRDLERHWSTGSSVLRAALAGRRVTHAALALLLITATGILESTLMQRSTNIASEPVKDPKPFNITSQLSPRLPYTGWMATGGYVVVNLDPTFANVVRNWTSNAPINSNFTDCGAGTCAAVVSGAGLVAACTSKSSDIVIGPTTGDYGAPPYPSKWLEGHTVFETTFTPGYGNDSVFMQNISLDVVSSSAVAAADGHCTRTIVQKSCNLRPAIVQYPISISNGTVSIDKTARNGSPFYDVDSYLTINETDSPYYSFIGGIEMALSNLYTSIGWLEWEGTFGDGYVLTSNGSLLSSYYSVGANDPLDSGYACNQTFHDPTNDLLFNIHDLMLRVAVNNATVSDQAPAQAVATGLLNYYQSSYRFLAIAVALVWLNIFVIVPMFYGWWHIGRKISLNPIEVADAFNSPVFQKDRPHRDVGELIDQVGHRAVVFKPVEHALQTDDGHRVFRAMKIVAPEQQAVFGGGVQGSQHSPGR